MGVSGLWQVLDKCKTRVDPRSLKGLKLAVDVSIWLHQAGKSVRTRNSHIQLAFIRICKLLHYGIDPVFVFDGQVPFLKRKVMASRRKNRQECLERKRSMERAANVLRAVIGGDDDDNSFKDDDDKIFAVPSDKKLLIDLDDEDEFEVVIASDDDEIDFNEFSQKSSQEFSSFQLKKFVTDIEFVDKSSIDEKDAKSDNPFRNLETDKEFTWSISNEDLLKVNQLSNEKSRKLRTKTKEINDGESRRVEKVRKRSLLKNKEKIGSREDFKVDLAVGYFGDRNVDREKKMLNIEEKGESRGKDAVVEEKEKLLDPNEEIEFGDKKVDQEKELLNNEEKRDGLGNDDVVKEDLLDSEKKIGFKKDLLTMDNKRKVSEKDAVVEENEELLDSPNKNDLNKTSKDEVKDLLAIEEKRAGWEKDAVVEEDSEKEIDFDRNSNIEDQRVMAQENAEDEDEQIFISLKESALQNGESDDEDEMVDVDLSESPSSSPIPLLRTCIAEAYSDLTKHANALASEANSITDQIILDVKYLLDLFNIPIVQSPAEAEAQCAFLEKIGRVHGVISEDSDVIVFGAKKVFRNFFRSTASVLAFDFSRGCCDLDQEDLICLAMLSGCDYSDGLRGIGMENALAICRQFKEGSVLERLEEFKKHVSNEEPAKKQWKRLFVPDTFPSADVYSALKNPDVVDAIVSERRSRPNFRRIRAFIRSRLGWPDKRTQIYLDPLEKTTRKPTALDKFVVVRSFSSEN